MNEQGYCLLESMIALPVLVFLLSVLGGCLLWTVKMASWQKADWEAQEEVRYIMERIVEDACRSDYANIQWQGRTLYLYYRGHYTPEYMDKMPEYYAKYDRLWTSEENAWIFIGKNAVPATGKSLLGKVAVTAFHCRMETPHILHVELTGKSCLTGHEFSLETAVCMKGSEGE